MRSVLGYCHYTSLDELLCIQDKFNDKGFGKWLQKKEPLEMWKDLTKTLKNIEAEWYNGKGTGKGTGIRGKSQDC